MPNIQKILSHYGSESPAIRTNLYRLLSHGRLGSTGRLLIQAVDQGFEHGPARSFVDNFLAFDPNYHFQMACDAGISGFAAPLGWLQSAVDNFVGKVPLVLKINSSNTLYSSKNAPDQTQTSTVDDAVRLGCVGVGFTLYPGSDSNLELMREAKEIIEEARSKGLFTVLWSYARGGDITKENESGIDVIAYGAHMACLLGAHIVKVKLPQDRIALSQHEKVYKEIPTQTLTERIKHVVDCCFMGKRIVIFSGGETKTDTDLLSDAQSILEGGGFGSIIGRNIFQRKREDAIDILEKMINIFKN